LSQKSEILIAISIDGVTRYMSSDEAVLIHRAIAKAVAWPLESGRETHCLNGVKVETVDAEERKPI